MLIRIAKLYLISLVLLALGAYLLGGLAVSCGKPRKLNPSQAQQVCDAINARKPCYRCNVKMLPDGEAHPVLDYANCKMNFGR